MKKVMCLLVAGGFVFSAVQAAEFVDIGNAGNLADGATGYGAVDYDYRIGQYEITIEQFNLSGIGGATGAAGTPAVDVSWHDAAMYCNWRTSGNVLTGAYQLDGLSVTGMMSRVDILADGGLFYVLPTIDEWYKAAYSTGGDSYSLYANGTGTAPIAGTEANYGGAAAPWLVDSGALELNNGTKNMMGNAYEWTSTDGGAIANQIILGGAYASDTQSMKSTTSFIDVTPGTDTGQIGFRVVAIPEPGTISLMGLSTVGLFLTRRMSRRKKLGRTLVPVRCKNFCDAYCSREEWEELTHPEFHAPISNLKPIWNVSMQPFSVVWDQVRKTYKRMDMAFWDQMVLSHDHRVIKRKAFLTASKQKMLNRFDSFLSLIMK